MILELQDVMTRFSLEKAEYQKRLNTQFDFLVGKYFGVMNTSQKVKKFYGKITSVDASEMYDSFNKTYSKKFHFEYENKKGELKSISVIYEELWGSRQQKKFIIYGDSEEEVRLLMEVKE